MIIILSSYYLVYYIISLMIVVICLFWYIVEGFCVSEERLVGVVDVFKIWVCFSLLCYDLGRCFVKCVNYILG